MSVRLLRIDTRESDFVYSDAGKKIQQRVWDELIDILADVEPRVKTLVKG